MLVDWASTELVISAWVLMECSDFVILATYTGDGRSVETKEKIRSLSIIKLSRQSWIIGMESIMYVYKRESALASKATLKGLDH